MPSSTLTNRRPRWRVAHPDPGTLRRVGFSLLAVVGVALAYKVTSHSPSLAVAAVLAVSTAAALHARLAVGRAIGAIQVVACATALLLLGAPPRFAGAVLLTGLLGSGLVARCTTRSSLVQLGLWTGIVGAAATASGLLAAGPHTVSQSLWEAVAAGVGGFVGAPLTLAVGPVAERLFGHATRWTMGEWLSYDHPLLRELAVNAAGTFQHSVNVGVLADAAATAIGADAFLARVGGLYHDVGKIRAPEYFTENQHGRNPHDELKPWDSAAILRAHVADGVDLVTRHRMGPQIGEFVREHHGTGVMLFFRDKAAQLGAARAEHETYHYPGPRPRSHETAIVMMADQVEATARSSPPADDVAADAIVRRTVERLRAEQQLDDAGLTPPQISQVEGALSRALQAMYHHRVNYPVGPAAAQAPAKLRLVARVLGRRRMN